MAIACKKRSVFNTQDRFGYYMDDEHRANLEEINQHLERLVDIFERLLKLSELKL